LNASLVRSKGRFFSILSSIDATTQKGNSMKRIYVGNLSFGVSEDSVRSIFEEYGTVDLVSIATNRDTGERRAFGFVEMGSSGEADKAIAGLNGREVGGRALNVTEARPEEEGGGFRHRRNGIFSTQSRNSRY
jgi:cold-inducible RNA-binding protein